MLLLVAADQLTKYKAGNVFLNYNFAFSLPLPPWLMYLIYLIVLCLIVKHMWQNFYKFNLLTFLPWLLIFSGALSNVCERIILGYVRDWVYIWTGVFNLADGYIILGILFLVFKQENSARL